MGISRQINIVMVSLALSIFCQLLTFATPGWFNLHINPDLVSTRDSNLEIGLQYGVWYIIACVKGHVNGYYISKFQCTTMSYHNLWRNMRNNEEYEANVFESLVPTEMQTEMESDKAKADGYAAIVQWEIQITLALVSALVAISLMRRQSLQFANLEMGDTTVPPSRNIYGAVFLFTAVSGCLLMVPSVAFIRVNMVFKKAASLSSHTDVGFPYCLVLSVFAAFLMGIAFLSIVCLYCLTCRRQEETLQCEPTSGQNQNLGHQQALPLVSVSVPPQGPNKQPPQAYMYPNQQYSSSGGYPEKSTINGGHHYSPNNQQGWYRPPPPEEQGNPPDSTVQFGQNNVQYWPSDKYASAQYQTNVPGDKSHRQPESHSNVQMRSYESQGHPHSQAELGYRHEKVPQDKGNNHIREPGAGKADYFQRALPDLPENDNAHYLAQEHHNEMGRWSNNEYGDPADNHDEAQLLVGSRSGREDEHVVDDFNPPPYWKQPPPI